MATDFAYKYHCARARAEGFRPMTRRQFEFRLGVCRLSGAWPA